MKRIWDIVTYFFLISVSICVFLCIYKREWYLTFKAFLLLVFWICMALENNSLNKDKLATKTSIGSIVVFASLFILEMIDL